MHDWKSTTLTLGHSPDPDDAHVLCDGGKQDRLKSYRFAHILQDIQSLNERATRGELHLTAVSIRARLRVRYMHAAAQQGKHGRRRLPLFIGVNAEGLDMSDDATGKNGP